MCGLDLLTVYRRYLELVGKTMFWPYIYTYSSTEVLEIISIFFRRVRKSLCFLQRDRTSQIILQWSLVIETVHWIELSVQHQATWTTSTTPTTSTRQSVVEIDARLQQSIDEDHFAEAMGPELRSLATKMTRWIWFGDPPGRCTWLFFHFCFPFGCSCEDQAHLSFSLSRAFAYGKTRPSFNTPCWGILWLWPQWLGLLLKSAYRFVA